MKKTEKLRQALKENKLLVTAGAHDALSAKIIEQAGFESVFISVSVWRPAFWEHRMQAC